MAGLFSDFNRLSKVVFVFKTVGEIFLKLFGLTSVVQQYVSGSEEEGKCHEESVNTFKAESESLLYLHSPLLLKTDKEQFRQFHDFTLKCGKPIATILASNQECCRQCGKQLVMDNKLHPVVIYSSQRGTYLGSRVTKLCRKCKIYEHYGYWTLDGKKHYDIGVLCSEFLLSSEDTAFHLDLLAQCGNLLFLGAVPFSTFTASYNRRFNYNKPATGDDDNVKVKRMKRETAIELQELLEQRMGLDRRRLEEGFLLFASLQTIEKYNLWIQVPTIPHNKNEMVELVTKEFISAFLKKWGEHACETPGCRKVLVLDGNMKNARQVCLLKDIGELQFSGMPGTVRVGCQSTPAKGSRYCSLHSGMAMVFRDDSKECNPNKEPDIAGQPGSLIRQILNEKNTRQGNIYEVLWADGRQSWVKENNLPSKIQQCMKDGSIYQQHPVAVDEFGQKRTELKKSSVNLQHTYTAPVKSSGFALENDTIENHFIISCGTEKGRHKSKNHRTAGILAIAKPCSIVVDVKELFGSESKSQVYAHLHELLSNSKMNNIETICYDDACHLKKYAENKVRRDLTATSQRMANMQIIVDKFHFKNHVDKWCKANCNPYKTVDLEGVNTEVCEQLFSWLSKFSHISKHMNRWRFLFIMLYVLDNHNSDIEQQSRW